tara:strand:- start:80 stop:277 length:198 start_codon:yes stop_codon:yes gene_type:complete
MDFQQITKLISEWPKNKEVPQLMKAAFDKATGEDKNLIGRATEALYSAANTEKDFDLIFKYWGES